MTDAVPPEDQGGDPPCWAEQFADLDEDDGCGSGDPAPEDDQDDGRSSRV